MMVCFSQLHLLQRNNKYEIKPTPSPWNMNMTVGKIAQAKWKENNSFPCRTLPFPFQLSTVNCQLSTVNCQLDSHLLRQRKGHRDRPISYLATLGFLLFAQPSPNKFDLAFAHSSVWLKILLLRSEHLAECWPDEWQVSINFSVCLL